MEPFDDPILGRVEWNERFNQWFCQIVTPEGNSAEFSIDEGELAEMLPLAREAYTWLCDNEGALRDQVAEQMLELANQWRQEGEPEITATTFAERITLSGAGLAGDGALSLTYYDGDMFGGHGIVANVGADRVMGEPSLFG